jgi:succinoglycan biosynthesis transport protein ExoP
MELRQYLNVVIKWWWLIAVSVFIAAGASYLASRAATPLYYTKTTLMVGRFTQNPDPSSVDFYTGQQLAYTYSQLARREPVLRGAIENLGLDMSWEALAGQISANVVPQTQLLEISVLDSDPYRAKVLADALAQQLILQSPTTPNATDKDQIAFSQQQLADLKGKIDDGQQEILRLKQELDAANSARQIQSLQNQINLLDTKISDWQSTYSQLLISLQGGDVNVLSVVEEATYPWWPISPNINRNVLLASVIGLALAVGGAFVIEYLDDTIKSPKDVTRTANLPTLGTLARIEGEDYPGKLIALQAPLSPAVEAYRVLRTNLQFAELDRPLKTLMITSPNASEGKSLVVANLAVVIAQSGQRVVLVDTDLRRPVMHEIFRLPNRHGLSDAVLHTNPLLAERLQATQIKNLKVLTSGPQPPNPAELLGSTRMLETIENLTNLADIVLFDSPPALIVSDATILGTRLDGVIMVNDYGRTRSSHAHQAVENLRQVRVNLIGVVLNRMTTDSYDYYYRSYGSQDRSQEKPQRKMSWRERIFPFPRHFTDETGKLNLRGRRISD